VQLTNVPRIRDVETMLELLRNLGAEAEWTGENDIRVHAQDIASDVDEGLAGDIRASFLLTGPLLARNGHVRMPPPGGDVIGRRRLDPHIHAFSELGASIEVGERYELAGTLRGAHIHLDEPSVMGTENAVMAASLTPGQTLISNAASEPHVQDLCRFLVTLGASIGGIGSNVLHISGVESLGGGTHSISPEHIEVGSFIGMAALTGGDLTIEGISGDDLWPILPVFRRFGIEVELGEDWLRVPPYQTLVIQDDLGGAIPKVEDGPWPQFPADLTSIAVVVATQAEGTVLIFEKMFESRLFFVDKLVSMGARIILCDPHRVVSPDIRAGMAMVIAALCAEGTSTIGDAYQIDKGYERIDERLRALGARIERVES
jgi:UDP-N-acetylglucosamine 1-carboxyvinyltransferase